MSRLAQLEKEIEAESALGILLAPYRPEVIEVDRRTIKINGREIVEKEMSNNTFRVFVDGMETSWDYGRCMRWAGGLP